MIWWLKEIRYSNSFADIKWIWFKSFSLHLKFNFVYVRTGIKLSCFYCSHSTRNWDTCNIWGNIEKISNCFRINKCIFCWNYQFFKFKNEFPTIFIENGSIVIFSKFLQPSKKVESRLATDEGKFIFIKFKQFLKALNPIDLSEDGKMTPYKLSQSMKLFGSIEVIVDGRVIFANFIPFKRLFFFINVKWFIVTVCQYNMNRKRTIIKLDTIRIHHYF